MEHLIATYLAAAALVGIYTVWLSVTAFRLSRRLKNLETSTGNATETRRSKNVSSSRSSQCVPT